MNRRTITLNLVLALLAVLIAVVGAALLRATRPQPEKAQMIRPVYRVGVMVARPNSQAVTVDGMGEVKPAHEVVVQPEIAGRVIARAENLIPGGLVAEGEVLVRIDARDQAAAIAAQESAIAQARLQLADERGRQDVAASDWQQGIESLDESSREFALRKPHVASAQSSLSSAKAQLDKVKRDRGRATIRAPFDAIVREATVEIGQLATQSSRLATLVNINRYRIEVSVPVAHLAHLDIPGVNVAGPRGSAVEVRLDAGPNLQVERTGYIERLLSDVDNRGRMAKLLVTVEDPLALGVDLANRPLPLLLGSFVQVAVTGRSIPAAVRIPRTALVDERFVWVVRDSKLHRRPVEIVWRDRTSVIAQGLRSGEAILVTPLAAPTEGLEVIVEEEVEPFVDDGRGRRPELTSIAGKG